MRMWRSGLYALCLAGGLSAAGCTDKGTYRATWAFTGGEAAGSGCGQHGVDAVRVKGASAGGDVDDAVTLCAPGGFTHEVPVGDWTFTFQQLDVHGVRIEPTDAQGQVVAEPTATGGIGKDALIDLAPVELVARPACRDGVDNDRDGRIDLDDADCLGEPNTATECPATGC